MKLCGLPRGFGYRDVPLTGDVAGAVGVPVDEFDRVGVSRSDDDPAEVVDGVVKGEEGRLLPPVRGAGGGEAAIDLVGKESLSP